MGQRPITGHNHKGASCFRSALQQPVQHSDTSVSNFLPASSRFCLRDDGGTMVTGDSSASAASTVGLQL